MKKRITDIINIDSSLTTPIYKQIVQSIYQCIEKGELAYNDMLPSVNSISETFSLARGSVFTAYNDLRASGIIDSIPGKGYFVTSTRVHQKRRIFLLFSKLTPYEAHLYNAITRALPDDCAVDLYFHHHDIRLFDSLITEQADRYNTFVIVPEVHPDTPRILSRLDEKHLFLLDEGYREYKKSYHGVYQHPEKDMYAILIKFRERVLRYKRLFLVLPHAIDSRDIIAGFRKFSKNTGISAEVIQTVEETQIKKGDAFIIYDDCWLVNVVKWVKAAGHRFGKDIGVISYQDNLLKEVVADGITTFAPDLDNMGRSIAEMIVSGDREVVENPVLIIDRKSF